MSNTNAFLPFATGASPNVVSDAVYSTLAVRNTGFQSGRALSNEFNKVWRQSSIITTMIAQFTADFGPSNVVDDGNITNLESQFEAALEAYLLGQLIFVPIIQGTVYYVDGTNGTDDAAHGASAGAGAFRSIIYAVSTISKNFSAVQVTVNVAAGTYPGFNVTQSLIASWNFVGSGSCTIDQSSGAGVSDGYGVNCFNSVVSISGFTIKAYYSGVAANNSRVLVYGCNFGACANGFCVQALFGGIINLWGPGATTAYTISGASGGLLNADETSYIQVGYQDAFFNHAVTITFSGATFSNATVYSVRYSNVAFVPSQVTWVGTPTGARYNGDGARINTAGSGTSWIPGTSAGSLSNGAIYA